MASRWTSDRTASALRTISASRFAATSAPDVGHPELRRRHVLAVGQLGRRAAPTDRVDGPVMDDREQPGLHAAASLDVAGGIAPRAQEGVLDDVLGEGRVIRDAVGDRVGHRLVAVVQLIQCVELPGRDPRQDRPIRVIGDGRDPQRERPAGLVHRMMRTSAAAGSLGAPSRSEPAVDRVGHRAATVSRSALASMTTKRSGVGRGEGQEPVPHAVDGRRGRTRPRSG